MLNTKTEIKAAIIEKGVDVTDDTTFRAYADKIREIEGGSGGEDVGDIDPNVTVIDFPSSIVANENKISVLMDDGNILVAGINIVGIWKYNIAQKTWTQIDTSINYKNVIQAGNRCYFIPNSGTNGRVYKSENSTLINATLPSGNYSWELDFILADGSPIFTTSGSQTLCYNVKTETYGTVMSRYIISAGSIFKLDDTSFIYRKSGTSTTMFAYFDCNTKTSTDITVPSKSYSMDAYVISEDNCNVLVFSTSSSMKEIYHFQRPNVTSNQWTMTTTVSDTYTPNGMMPKTCILPTGVLISYSSSTYGTGLYFYNWSAKTFTQIITTGYNWLNNVCRVDDGALFTSTGLYYYSASTGLLTLKTTGSGWFSMSEVVTAFGRVYPVFGTDYKAAGAAVVFSSSSSSNAGLYYFSKSAGLVTLDATDWGWYVMLNTPTCVLISPRNSTSPKLYRLNSNRTLTTITNSGYLFRCAGKVATDKFIITAGIGSYSTYLFNAANNSYTNLFPSGGTQSAVILYGVSGNKTILGCSSGYSIADIATPASNAWVSKYIGTSTYHIEVDGKIIVLPFDSDNSGYNNSWEFNASNFSFIKSYPCYMNKVFSINDNGTQKHRYCLDSRINGAKELSTNATKALFIPNIVFDDSGGMSNAYISENIYSGYCFTSGLVINMVNGLITKLLFADLTWYSRANDKWLGTSDIKLVHINGYKQNQLGQKVNWADKCNFDF